jgi:hypothetical protein
MWYSGGTSFAMGEIGYATSDFPVSVENNKPREIPQEFSLLQNYPNPFNPSTTIQYDLPIKAYVTLKIYNSLGQEVATLVDGDLNAGIHTTQWNGSGAASGLYFYRLQAGDFVDTKKLLLLK